MKKVFTGKIPFVKHDAVPCNTHWQGTFSHHVFSLTLSGRADYKIPGGSFKACRGDFLHFMPEAWQDWKVSETDDWSVYYILVDLPPTISHLFSPQTVMDGISQIHLNESDIEKVRTVFEEMNEWELSGTQLVEEIIINRLEFLLLLIKTLRPSEEIVDSRVEQARKFLHRSVETYISLDDVVEEVSLSKARISGLFQESFGIAPITYLEKIRMERAAQLLNFTSETPMKISQRLCYSDSGYFNKRFKRYWGMTPRQYRLQNQSR